MSTVVVLPAVTVASRTVVRKPVFSDRTSYSPGSRADALKMPEALAVTLRAAPVALLVMVIAAAAHYIPQRWYDGGLQLYCRFPYYAQAAAIAALAVAIRYVAGSGSAPFIYSRF